MNHIDIHFYNYKPRIRVNIHLQDIDVPMVGDSVLVPKHHISDMSKERLSKIYGHLEFKVCKRTLSKSYYSENIREKFRWKVDIEFTKDTLLKLEDLEL